MGFQALFKFVKCWRAPDIARETVPSSSKTFILTGSPNSTCISSHI